MEYLNFSIRIEPKPGDDSRYVLEASSWDGAERDAELDAERLSGIPELALARAGLSREAFEDDGGADAADDRVLTAEDMQRIGDALYAALFESSLGTFMADCRRKLPGGAQAPPVRLVLDFNLKEEGAAGLAELAKLPWELLRSDDWDPPYLNLSVATSVVRSLRTGVAGVDRVRRPLKVLFMESNPSGTAKLDLSTEIQALLRKDRAGEIEIERVDGSTLEALGKHVKHFNPHVFHFMGHGVGGDLLFERPGGDAAAGAGRDEGRAERVDAARLFAQLRPKDGAVSQLKLVFLNACETGKTEDFSDVASYLMRNGVPAVVAMQKIVLDAAAIAFSEVFYTKLVEGATLDHATTLGRLAIDEKLKDKAPLEWATPMLFLRKNFDGVLVDRTSQDAERILLHVEHPGRDRLSVWMEQDTEGHVLVCWHNPDGAEAGDEIVLFDREPAGGDVWTGRVGVTGAADETPEEIQTDLTVADVRKYFAAYLADGEIRAVSPPVIPPA
jgi:hypothetical protein